jgi:putative heme-binding domain-containing protein
LASADDAVRADMLRGLADVYRGRQSVVTPAAWNACYAALAKSSSGPVQDQSLELAVVFGDQPQIARLQDMVMKRTRATLDQRRRGLELLVAKRDPEFGKSVLSLIRDPDMRSEAIRALATYDLPEIPPRLVRGYSELSAADRQDAIQTLTSRPAFALALLGAIEAGEIPRQDVSALVIRQLLALENTPVTDRLRQVWGDIRPASADKKQRIDEFKSQLSADVLKAADLSHGRLLFSTKCATCHKLFDEGTKLGPELTGAQRHNLDYVLDNVLDPSAIVPREYRASVLRLSDGRIVQGVVIEETPQTIVVQTPNETLRLPAGDIEVRKESGLSMMPEGLFDRLTPDEIRDLVAYLASPQQVPLPAEGEK